MPEIKDCSCGSDHETMPMIDVSFEDQNPTLVEAVCRKHKRHEPCRPCIHEKYVDVEDYSQKEYRVALVSGLSISRIRELGGVGSAD